MRSCGYTPVISDDIVTDHETHERMMLYNIGNTC